MNPDEASPHDQSTDDTAWLAELRSSRAAKRMTMFTAGTGDVLLREDEPGNTFLVLTEGLTRRRPSGPWPTAACSPPPWTFRRHGQSSTRPRERRSL